MRRMIYAELKQYESFAVSFNNKKFTLQAKEHYG